MQTQHRRRHWAFVALLASLTMAGCGGDTTQPAPPPPPPPPPSLVIAVTPATASVQAGGSQEFTAHVTNVTNTAVSWTTSGGAIAGTGNTITWTAPTTAGSYSVTATSAADPTRQASAAITVPAPPPVVVVLDNATIGSGGGKLTVAQGPSPLRGLGITLLEDTYPTPTSWTVSELRVAQPTLPAWMKQVGPGILIRNGRGFADRPFLITIPIRVGPDSVPAAVMRDPDSGTFEVLPVIFRTDTSVVVMTQHVSANQMLQRGAAAGFRGVAGISAAPLAGEVEVYTVAAALADLGGVLTTAFLPGRDDWEFANEGSYLAPGGYCTGSTLAAIHHLYARTGQRGTLFGRYDSVGTHEYDNPRGVRLASVIQRNTLVSGSDAIDKVEQDRLFFEAGGSASQLITSWTEIQLTNLAVAMKAGGPQLLAIMPETSNLGHAIVAYRMNWTPLGSSGGGSIGVADPNFPGDAGRSITFTQHSIVPYDGSDFVGAPVKQYSRIFHVGVSALMPMNDINALWQEFDAETIGNNRFARTIAQYRDPADTLWRDVPANLKTAGKTLTFRNICPDDCAAVRGPGSKHPDRGFTKIYSDAGNILDQDLSDGQEGALITVQQGTHRYGLAHYSYSVDLTSSEWAYTNFTWTRVKQVPFVLKVNPEEPLPGQTVTFTVENPELGDATMRYRWTIDGGTPQFTSFNTPALEKTMPPDPLSLRVELVDATNHAVARIDSVITPEEFEITLTATPATVNRSGISTLKVTLDPVYTGQGLAYRYLSAQTQGQVSPPVGVLSSNTTATYTAGQWAPGGTETVKVEVVIMENGTEIGILGEAEATIVVNPYYNGSYGVIEPTVNCVAPFIFIPKAVGATSYEVIADGFNHPTLGTMYTTTFSGPSGGTGVFDVQDTGSQFRIRMEGGGCAISDMARQAMATAMNQRFAGIKVRVKASP